VWGFLFFVIAASLFYTKQTLLRVKILVWYIPSQYNSLDRLKFIFFAYFRIQRTNNTRHFMRKFITNTAIILAASNSLAFALPDGSHLGIDVSRSTSAVKTYKVSPDNSATYFDTISKGDQVGYGINYKYMMSTSWLMHSPEFFCDRIGSEAKINDTTNRYSQTLNVKNRCGARIDIGINLMRDLTIYAPLGYSLTSYELKTRSYSSTGTELTTTTNGAKFATLYGVGIMAVPIDNVVLSLEYNRQVLNIRSRGNVALNSSETSLRAKTNLDMIKFGISYRY